jgi:hypothetical protein
MAIILVEGDKVQSKSQYTPSTLKYFFKIEVKLNLICFLGLRMGCIPAGSGACYWILQILYIPVQYLYLVVAQFAKMSPASQALRHAGHIPVAENSNINILHWK